MNLKFTIVSGIKKPGNYKSKISKKKEIKKDVSVDSKIHKNIDLDDVYDVFSNTGKREKLNGTSIMNEALEIGERIKTDYKKNQEQKNNILLPYNVKFKDQLVRNTQDSARTNYIENLSQKFKFNLNNNFKENLYKSNERGKLQLEKIMEKLFKIKQKYEIAKNENDILESQLVSINNELREISHDIVKKNQEINKQQIKFESFKVIQPVIEELVKEFPNEDPKKLISSFRLNKDKYIAKVYELDDLREKVYFMEKEKNNEEQKNNKFQMEMQSKIDHQKVFTEAKKSQYEKEYNVFKDEYETLKLYGKQNVYLKKMLYDLFILIKKYIPYKKYQEFVEKYGRDPSKNCKKFNETIFNHKLFVDLIKNNILNSVPNCYSGIQLRNTIAFSNYLARRHLKQSQSFRYDPSVTFREIKNLIDKKEFQNSQLTGIIKNLTKKNSDSELKIYELKHQLQIAKIKFETPLKKIQRYLKDQSFKKSVKEKNFVNLDGLNCLPTRSFSSNKSSRTKTFSEETVKKHLRLDDKNRGNSKEKKFIPEDDTIIEIDKKNKTTSNFLKVKKKFFITNDGQKGKKNYIPKDIIKEENKDNKFLILKTPNNTNNHAQLFNGKFPKNLKKFNIKDNSKKTFILQKNLKDLEISENRDKILKTNGFNGTDNLLLHIKDIMKELLSNEASQQILELQNNKNKIDLLKKRPLTLKKNPISKKKSRDQIEARPVTSVPNISYGENYNSISNKIMSDIDNIITTINQIDLHDFSTDQNYQNKRKMNLFNKEPKEKIEKKKNSLDSIINEKSGEVNEEEKSEENEEEESEKSKEDSKKSNNSNDEKNEK